MTPKTKKKLSYFVIGLFFFLGGVEYAVILPTAWLYLENRYNAEAYILGLLIASFSLSSLFAGPIMGRWSDKLGRTKGLFIFANLWELVGNVMYFLGFSKWFLVAARLVAGVGAGVGAPIIADISRVTSSQERTGVISLFMAVRQIGLVIGPGCNLFLRECNFYIGPFLVDKYSAPGAFMAVLWLVLEVLVIFIYWDLPLLQHTAIQSSIGYSYREDSDSQFPPASPSPTFTPNNTEDVHSDENAPLLEDTIEKLCKPQTQSQEQRPREEAARPYPNLEIIMTSSNEMIESAERYMGTGSPDSGPIMFSASSSNENSWLESPENRVCDRNSRRSSNNGYGAVNGHVANTNPGEDHLLERSPDQNTSNNNNLVKGSSEGKFPQKLSWSFYYDEYIREEVIAILATCFIAFFNQTAMEAMITPLTASLLDWGELENSILYCVAGLEIMVVFVIIQFLSKRIHDRNLLLFGFAIVMVTIAGLVWYLPQAPPHNRTVNLPWMIVGVALDVAGLPFLVVTSTSLYSKVTREETQGFSQGLRGVCGGIGTLLGPLWADSLLDRLYLMLGVMLGIMAIAMLMLVLSYKHLKEKPAELRHSIQRETERPQIVESLGDEREPLLNSVPT